MNKNEASFVRCLKCHKILQCSRYDTLPLLQHIRTDHPEVEISNRVSKEGMQNKLIGNKCKPGKPDKTKINGVNKDQNSTRTDISAKERQDQTTDHGSGKTRVCECTNDREANEMGANANTCPEFSKNTQEEEVHHRYDVQRDQIPESDRMHNAIKSELMDKYPEIKNCEFCPRNPGADVIYTKRYKLKTPSTTSAISSPRTPHKRNMYRTTIEKWRPASGTIYCPQCGCNKRPFIKSQTEQITQNQCFACCLFSCWPFCFIPCLIPDHEMEYLYCSNCKTFLGLYNRNLNCIKPNREYVSRDKGEGEDSLNIKINTGDKAYTNNSSADGSRKSNKKHLPSIVIDGKELHPDMVARLQRFRKYGHLAGIDLDAVTTEDNNSGYSPHSVDSLRDGVRSGRRTSGGRKGQYERF